MRTTKHKITYRLLCWNATALKTIRFECRLKKLLRKILQSDDVIN